MKKLEFWQLKQRQSLPLEAKVILSLERIRQWYEHYEGQVYVSFSGGKDSTVLLDLVRSLYPEVPGVFLDTGVEYPEIRSFVKGTDNVTFLKPKMSFAKVLEVYGYPVISKEQSQYVFEIRTGKSEKLRRRRLDGVDGKYRLSQSNLYLLDAPFKISHKCCDVLKKRPSRKYESTTGRKPFIGILAEESRLRINQYLRHGCNAFDLEHPTSNPLSRRTADDIWGYIWSRNLPYASIYDKGETSTGCIYCLFGIKQDPNRFQRLQRLHPKLYDYAMDRLGIREVLEYLGLGFQQTMEFEGIYF